MTSDLNAWIIDSWIIDFFGGGDFNAWGDIRPSARVDDK